MSNLRRFRRKERGQARLPDCEFFQLNFDAQVLESDSMLSSRSQEGGLPPLFPAT